MPPPDPGTRGTSDVAPAIAPVRRLPPSGCLLAGAGLLVAWGLLAIASGIGQYVEVGESDSAILLVIGAVFAVAGVGAWMLVRRLRRSERETRDLRLRHPGEPWLWNPGWAARRIEHGSRIGPMVLAFFATFWNLLAIPAGIAGLADRETFPAPMGYLILIFPAIGLGLAAWAVVAWTRWRKYGRSVLELQDLPSWVGEDFQARLVPAVPMHPAGGFQARLACIHRVTTGSGRSVRTDETMLWEGAGTFPDDGRAAGIRFRLPGDVPSTGRRTPRDEVVWRLRVEADMPGLDYRAVFAVPVFRRDGPGGADG